MSVAELLGGGSGPPHDIVRTSRGGVPSALSLAGGVPSDLRLLGGSHDICDVSVQSFSTIKKV